jgi:hypothetical protein
MTSSRRHSRRTDPVGVLRRGTVVLLLAASAVLAAPSIASSGKTLELEVDLVSPSEPLAFRYQFPSGTCEQGPFELTVRANGEAVVPTFAQQSPVTADIFVFTLPLDTSGGELLIDATCQDGDSSIAGQGEKEWAALTVRKIVTGALPPDDTLFNVLANCHAPDPRDGVGTTNVPTDFTLDLTYTSGGGLHYLYTDRPTTCALTEPVTGGATTIIIDPEVVVMDEPGAFSATVTNVFTVASEPQFTG